MPRKPITCLDLNITSLPPRAPYFIAAVWRGDWTTNDCRCRNYYRPSRASLLRVNRAQRLLIQRVVNGYVADLPAPALRVCGYYECDQIALPDGDYCAVHQAEYDDFVMSQTSAPAVTIIPETNTELAKLVTSEFEAAALVADDFERALDERDAQGVTVAERIERR